MSLLKVKPGQTFQVKSVTGNEKNKNFLFSLGCYEGQDITLISILGGNYIINIKDCRFAIDKEMANSIVLA